jgi:hypothetical protein
VRLTYAANSGEADSKPFDDVWSVDEDLLTLCMPHDGMPCGEEGRPDSSCRTRRALVAPPEALQT